MNKLSSSAKTDQSNYNEIRHEQIVIFPENIPGSVRQTSQLVAAVPISRSNLAPTRR